MRDSVPSTRDIPAFVMYCVNGESGSSVLIESTYSMITIIDYYYYYFIFLDKIKIIWCIQLYSRNASIVGRALAMTG